MARYSLDTNAISHILRKDQRVHDRFRAALVAGHEFIICPIVYYELKRGLLKKDARRQLGFMSSLIAKFGWRDFDKPVWEAAAQGWADSRRQGRPAQESDLLIAYHAHRYEAIVVTANTKDFTRFPIRVENWQTP